MCSPSILGEQSLCLILGLRGSMVMMQGGDEDSDRADLLAALCMRFLRLVGLISMRSGRHIVLWTPDGRARCWCPYCEKLPKMC